ncbi:MAG TPA: patatin-like phospholipase family protein [Xanthomonadaceae bacterium]|nr:patatin-like phospholipase family protein [Xanthomonadaceae bacterium]
MLLIQPANKRHKSQSRIGLAIAGGGPIGGMYELGALRALDEAIEGLDLTRLEVYVGVSSGAFLAAGLANRMSTDEMCRVFITGRDDRLRFRPEAFLRPAVYEYLRRAAGFPAMLLGWWRDLLMRPGSARLSEAIMRFSELIPPGLFDNTEIENFLRDAFTIRGRSNDFRKLDRPLYVVAVDLNSGEAVRFGDGEWNDVPISRAVQASAAMPGLYQPVEIRGRQFVDGALRRTMHASVALKHGIDLLIGINPLVPFDSSAASATPGHTANLADGGLPVVLSQTFRTLLQSRAQVGIARYAQQFPQTDQLVLEPNSDDAEMFFTNLFSYSSRIRVCQHAYRATLDDLGKRRTELAPLLARHGLRLREEVIDDPQRTLLGGLRERPHPTDTTARLHRALDDVDDALKQRRRAAHSA